MGRHKEKSLEALLALSLETVKVRWDVALVQDGWLQYNCHVARSATVDFITRLWKSKSKKRWVRLYRPFANKLVRRNTVVVSFYENRERVAKIYVSSPTMASHFESMWRDTSLKRSVKVVSHMGVLKKS